MRRSRALPSVLFLLCHEQESDHFRFRYGRKKYKSLIATPQLSIQTDPISSEVSGSTDSSLELVPAIVSELIELVAAIGLVVDVHKCMTKASLQLQCDPKGTAEPQVHNSRCSWPMNYTVLSFMMIGHLNANLLVCKDCLIVLTSSDPGLSATSRKR